MRRSFLLYTIVLIGLLVGPAPLLAKELPSVAVATDDAATLPKDVAEMLKSGDLAKTRVGITVVDAATGEVLADYHGTEKMNPASNQKLLTSAVALDHMEPGFRTKTTLEGNVSGGVVKGGVVVRGGGDVTLDESSIYNLANQLRRRGIKMIDGGIVVDEGDFGSGLPPAFDQKNEAASYRAAVSGFSVSFNGIYVTVEPAAKVGEPPEVLVAPFSDRVKIINQATTIAGRSWPVIGVSETPEAITVTVSGNSGQRSGAAFKKNRVDQPTLFAASVLKYALESLGIKVNGGITVKSNVGKRPLLASHESQALATDLYLMNKFSNNFIAEMLFRRLGTLPNPRQNLADDGKGVSYSGKTALAAYQNTLEKAGLGRANISVKNGSGLYDGNLISTQDIAKLLLYAAKQPWAAEFQASLPIAGQDGSLKNRFKKTPLDGRFYAKTGTLNEVSALSGYATAKSGRPIIVSILFNGTPKFAWLMRKEQDKIAQTLVNSF